MKACRWLISDHARALAMLATVVLLLGGSTALAADTTSVDAWRAAVLARATPPTNRGLAAGRDQLLARLDDLRRLLDEQPDGGVTVRLARLDDLATTAKAAEPDTAVLDDVARRLGRSFPDSIRQAVDILRREVQRQAGWLRFRRQADAPAETARHVNRLAVFWQQPPTSAADELAVRESFAWLMRTRLFDREMAVAAEQLSSANQIIRVERAYIVPLTDKPITQPVKINENQKGVQIRGAGQMTARPKVELRPNTQQAEINLHVTGVGTVPLVARKKPATIQATSNTRFTADQTMLITPDGIDYRQPQVRVTSRTVLRGVDLDLNCQLLKKLINPLARKVASKQLAQGDQEIVAKAKKQITETLNEQAFSAIDHVNELLGRLLWKTIDARDVQRNVRVQTTTDELSWIGEFRTPWQLAALAPPPELRGRPAQIEMRVHESSFNNTAAVAAGRRIDEMIFEELVFETLRLRPETPRDHEGGRQAASFSLAALDPLDVRFVDGHLQARITIENLELDGLAVPGPVRTVRFAYRPLIDDRGVTLERVGNIEIEPRSAPQAEQVQAALARFLVPRARAGAPPQSQSSTNRSASPPLHFTDIQLDRGWLQIGLAQPTNP